MVEIRVSLDEAPDSFFTELGQPASGLTFLLSYIMLYDKGER